MVDKSFLHIQNLNLKKFDGGGQGVYLKAKT